MKKLIIFKLGGSVITYKNRQGIFMRRKLIDKIAKVVSSLKDKINYDIVFVHGAGSSGHQIVKKYQLQSGIYRDENKWLGSLECIYNNQKNNIEIVNIFLKNKLKIFPIHTSSIVVQNNQKVIEFYTDLIDRALKNNCIPCLYGDMVFDDSWGMSICSGDEICPYLAKAYKVSKIVYATDVEGIFDKDPYINKNAKLIKKIKLVDIMLKANLEKSHNIDVTGGLIGKISKISLSKNKYLKNVELFNGLKIGNYKKILLNEKFDHTIIEI